jgi:hypothetical protein
VQKKISRREQTESDIPLTAIRDCAVATTTKIHNTRAVSPGVILPPEGRTYLYNQAFPASRERATQASFSSRATSRNQVSALDSDSKYKPRRAHLTIVTRVSTPEVKIQTTRIAGCGGRAQTTFTTYFGCLAHLLAENPLFSQREAPSWYRRSTIGSCRAGMAMHRPTCTYRTCITAAQPQRLHVQPHYA